MRPHTKAAFTEKIQAIEDFDAKIVRPVLDGLSQRGEAFRILVLPDHPTPLSLKTHSADPVPFILYDSAHTPAEPLKQTYCEMDAQATGVFIADGWTLMDRLIRKK